MQAPVAEKKATEPGHHFFALTRTSHDWTVCGTGEISRHKVQIASRTEAACVCGALTQHAEKAQGRPRAEQATG